MARLRRDAGDTLVEILVALAVLSIGIVGLVAALGANITTTVLNRDQSQAESTLASAAEYVKTLPAATLPFGCPGGGSTVVSPGELPRNTAYTITYGPAEQFDGLACARAVAVPVTVEGNGFTLTVRVVRRT